jgi:hypothetical protein
LISDDIGLLEKDLTSVLMFKVISSSLPLFKSCSNIMIPAEVISVEGAASVAFAASQLSFQPQQQP